MCAFQYFSVIMVWEDALGFWHGPCPHTVYFKTEILSCHYRVLVDCSEYRRCRTVVRMEEIARGESALAGEEAPDPDHKASLFHCQCRRRAKMLNKMGRVELCVRIQVCLRRGIHYNPYSVHWINLVGVMFNVRNIHFYLISCEWQVSHTCPLL